MPRAPQAFTAKFEDKTIINEKFVLFTFELVEPHNVPFDAGQYVSIQVSPKGDRRSYSICSSPDVDHGFEIVVDITPAGLGVNFLQNLQFGDVITGLAPMGQFVIANDESEKSLVLVATGSGIAPMRSMVLEQLQVKQDKRPMILYWGLRFAEDLFWEDDFSELSSIFTNFSFHPVLSKPTPEWTLCSGHVTDCLSIHNLLPDAGYYLCGNTAMIQDTKQQLLTQGIAETHIHHEKFY